MQDALVNEKILTHRRAQWYQCSCEAWLERTSIQLRRHKIGHCRLVWCQVKSTHMSAFGNAERVAAKRGSSPFGSMAATERALLRGLRGSLENDLVATVETRAAAVSALIRLQACGRLGWSWTYLERQKQESAVQGVQRLTHEQELGAPVFGEGTWCGREEVMRQWRRNKEPKLPSLLVFALPTRSDELCLPPFFTSSSSCLARDDLTFCLGRGRSMHEPRKAS